MHAPCRSPPATLHTRLPPARPTPDSHRSSEWSSSTLHSYLKVLGGVGREACGCLGGTGGCR